MKKTFLLTRLVTLIIFLFLLFEGTILADWFEDTWTYRRGIEVTNPCGEAVNGYQVRIVLDGSFDFSRALPDGSDVRVTAEDGETLIPFWIEEWDPDGTTASIWVKVPSIPLGGTSIYLYYGNTDAVTQSNASATFIAYDDFEDDVVGSIPSAGTNTGNWTKYAGNPVIDVANSGFGSTFYDSDAGIYHNFTSFGSILHYTSDDGISWIADVANNPVLTASQPWEGSNVGVPMVWKEDGIWYMLYRGGSPPRIGLATSTDAVTWTKSDANPVVYGDTGAWDDNSLDPWGVIKVGDTYYLWYNTIGAVSGLGRCTGLATSTNLTDWTKDPNNPIFSGGRFCAFPFKYGDYYYLLIPHYTSGTDYSQHELYRDSNPTFYPGEREYLGVAINFGPTDWDDHDQDTPCVLTDTIYRDTYAASNNELWVYYAGEGGDGSWRTGMCIEENIGEAIAGVQPNLFSWSVSGDVTVVDDPVYQGIQSVRLRDLSTGGGVQLTGNFGQQTGGVVGAWMRRSANSFGDYDIYLYGEQLSCVAGLGRDGDFHYWNGSFQPTGVGWLQNTWYFVTLAFDAGLETYDFIVYDESLSEIVRIDDIAFGRSSSYINSAVLYTSTGFAEDGFADIFRVRAWCGSEAMVTVGVEEEQPSGEELEIGIVSPANYQLATLQLPPDRTPCYYNRSYYFMEAPARYVGLPFIQTNLYDRFQTSENFLTFTANKPVRVYVAYQANITTPPNWLADNFISNGDLIHTSMGDLFTWEIWERDYPAGEIVLGANTAEGFSYDGPVVMYVVIIEELFGPQPPQITSGPVTTAMEGELYSYNVDAVDPNFEDTLTFSLDMAPTGMDIDAATGLIEWIPDGFQVGDNDVTVRVQDQGGLSDTQSFIITVAPAPPNEPPYITSMPVTTVMEGELYSYDVDADDPNPGDTLIFSFDTAPAGMNINSATGLIDWVPSGSQVGDNDVTVQVEDQGGLFNTQSFVILVAAAPVFDPPYFTSTPVTTGTESDQYTYDADAEDPNPGDTLTYSLDVAPVGMDIDASTGLIDWIPAGSQVGDNDVTIRVEDQDGLSETQSFTVTVRVAHAYWYDDTWTNRRGIEVTNPCGEAVDGYQVRIVLDDNFDFSRALPDGSDIRVTDADGETLLPFWIENWDPAGMTASIWVKVPSIPLGGTSIYLYYGNTDAVTQSNASATFIAYDDFEDDVVGSIPSAGTNTVNWTKYAGNPVIDVANSGFGSTFYDSDAGIYHNFTSFGSILHYTSDDGISWIADVANNPVLTASQPWEGSNVGVPMAWKEDGTWYMLYRGGSPDRIGLATSTDAVNWTKSDANPVVSGDTGAWDDNSLDPWGVIKVGDTYYLWYNTIGAVPGLGRCTGLATSTNLTDWTKDPNNPIFSGGRFCAFPFKYGDYYYLLIPHYTSGTDYSQHELYRDSNPTFYLGEREYLGVAINFGPTDWDDHDQDTPCVLTDTIYRDTYAASNNELWVYYAGEGGDGSWRTGMCIEENIGEAIAGVQPNLFSWSVSGDVTVVDDPVYQGIQSVMQHDTSSGSTQLIGSFSQQTGGVVGAWMQRSATSNGDYDIYLYGGSTLSCVAGLGRDGDFHYWNGSFQPTGEEWVPNTWYLVTLAFNANLDFYDFVVYDETLVEIVRVEGIAFGNTASYIDTVWLYTSGGFVEDGFADNFLIRSWCGSEAMVTVGVEEGQPSGEELEIGIASPATYQLTTLYLPPDRTPCYYNKSYYFTDAPADYVGLPFIQTNLYDRFQTREDFLTFTVNKPVRVYVAYQANITTPPNWLADNFIPNGDLINTSMGDLFTWEIWERDYPAGEIILGANTAEGFSYDGPVVMYVVIIEEL